MVLYIYMKFHKDILKGFKVKSGLHFDKETDTYEVQRDITKKICIKELQFLSSASRLCWLIFV